VRNMALVALNASVGHAQALVEGFVTVAGSDALARALLPADKVRTCGGLGATGCSHSCRCKMQERGFAEARWHTCNQEGPMPSAGQLCGPHTRPSSAHHCHPSQLSRLPQVTTYNQRIALLLFKLQAATSALGRLDHPAALGYALSMAHDAAGLHMAVRGTRKGLALELTCLGSSKRHRWWGVPGGAAVVCLVLVAWRAWRGRGSGGRDKSHLF
jgi:hypothetical protein